MASSLKSQSIKALFQDSPDEEKLEIFTDLCESIPTSVFLEHKNVKKHVQNCVCRIAIEIASNNEMKDRAPSGSTDLIAYLFLHSDWSFTKYAYHLDPAYVEDMLRYLKPWRWCWYLTKSDRLVVSEYQETEDWRQFNFRKHIVLKQIPSAKIWKIWQGDKSEVEWEVF